MQVQEYRPANGLELFCRSAGQAASEYFALKFRGQLFVHFVSLAICINAQSSMFWF
jgi:hypothetical protein